MDRCLACGREVPPGQGEVCPQCQAEGRLASPAQTKRVLRHRLTLALIIANTCIFLLMVAMGADFIRPSVGYAHAFGASDGVSVFLRFQVWRLWTANFIHYGVVHLLVNMYGLWVLGGLMELFYGRRDYLLLYTFTGVAGSVLGVFVHPFGVEAGASGALFGVAGALMMTLRFGQVRVPQAERNRLFREILLVSLVNLGLGFYVTQVSNAGHIGGLLAGLLVGLVMGKRLDASPEAKARRSSYWVWLWLGLAIVFLIFRVLRVGWIVVD